MPDAARTLRSNGLHSVRWQTGKVTMVPHIRTHTRARTPRDEHTHMHTRHMRGKAGALPLHATLSAGGNAEALIQTLPRSPSAHTFISLVLRHARISHASAASTPRRPSHTTVRLATTARRCTWCQLLLGQDVTAWLHAHVGSMAKVVTLKRFFFPSWGAMDQRGRRALTARHRLRSVGALLQFLRSKANRVAFHKRSTLPSSHTPRSQLRISRSRPIVFGSRSAERKSDAVLNKVVAELRHRILAVARLDGVV
jgi:hypothetical protein